MVEITNCPSCGSDQIRKVCRTWRGTFEGQRYSVPRLTFHECPDCGENVYGREAMRKIEARSPAYRKAHATK